MYNEENNDEELNFKNLDKFLKSTVLVKDDKVNLDMISEFYNIKLKKM